MNPALESYLAAPEHVRERFDRELAIAIADDAEWRRYHAELEADDPCPPAQPVYAGRQPRAIPTWDFRWQARTVQRPPASSTERDFAQWRAWVDELDLRSVFAALTGEDVPERGPVRCPLPDHDDLHPSATVYSDGRGWICFGCGRGGTAIDVAAAIYGIEPRGAGYFELCRKLETIA